MNASVLQSHSPQVAVIGGSPTGLVCAIAMAQAGIAGTALVARKSPYSDNRTTALLGDSIGFLESDRRLATVQHTSRSPLRVYASGRRYRTAGPLARGAVFV